jgi:hypothetical protein
MAVVEEGNIRSFLGTTVKALVAVVVVATAGGWHRARI